MSSHRIFQLCYNEMNIIDQNGNYTRTTQKNFFWEL